MKIVFIGGRDIHLIGGIESYMAHLSSELVRLGHEVIVYCESNRNETVMWNGVNVIHQKSIKSHFLCKPWLSLKATLRTLWNEKGVGIIHYNAWPPSLWGWLANLFGVKTLMQGHGLEWQRSKYSPKQQKIMKFMEKVTAHMNRNLIMCSDGQTKYFRDTYNREAVTIPTAVMLPAVHDIESDIMHKYNLEPKKYSRLSLCPKAPATAEDFEAELAYLTVSVRFSGVNTVNVRFEKTPDGSLEITGWEDADE